MPLRPAVLDRHVLALDVAGFLQALTSTNDSLPDDVETLKQQLLARDAELAQAQAEAASAQAEVANVRAEVSSAEALITHLRLEIEKLKRDLFGPRNERKERLLDQMELQLEDLEAAAIEDEIAAAKAAATTPVRAFTRNKPLPRGFAGPSLLAMILFEKYGQHQPLNRQSERYTREGIDLSVSTLADQVGGCAALLRPIYELIRAHVFAGARVHGDETTVPVLAKHQCRKGRLWTYVRDDKPFAGPAPPAAVFFYSRDRTAEHPERHLAGYAGILQVDAYAGFNRLYDANREPGPIIQASCWAHGRRKFFELADVAAKARGALSVLAPLAVEAVERIDAIFDIEREINGRSIEERLTVRRERVTPLVAELESWMRAQRAKLSRHSDVGKAMDYMLKRRDTFARFLADGRICLTNNAAERALRGIALGRKSWLFAGSDRGGERAAVMYTLLQTARLNDVDPQAWLADVLARINDHNIQRLDQLLPWNWKTDTAKLAA